MSREENNNRLNMVMMSINMMKLIELAPLEQRLAELNNQIFVGGSVKDMHNCITEYQALQDLISSVGIAKGLRIV